MANTKVTGDLIAQGTIHSVNLADGSVTATKLHNISTDHISEGTNLFYTDARVSTYLTTNNYVTTTEIANTANWDEAYSWGNHALVGYLTSFTETDPIFTASDAFAITSTQITNWDTAYGWGDHSAVGYLTSFTETDPIYSASSWFSTTNNASNWDTAYSWGNHATQSYATETYVNTAVANLVDSAPTTLDTLNELAAALGDDPNFATTVSTSIGTKWTQDNTKISNWDTAYSWGNHASVGYLTSLPSHTHDYVPERGRTDWNDGTVIDDVVGQLGWWNYGNNHTIFDASKSIAPGGIAKNNTNPDVSWSSTYPTLMGWNGSSTYGVRVDSSRFADYAGAPTSPTFTASGDFRAPIFYDSNNTGYYVDPNGVTNINHLRINGDWSSYGLPYTAAFTIRGTYPSVQYRSTSSNSMWLYHMDSAGNIQHYYAAGTDSESWSIKHTMAPDGVFTSTASMRSPIFYDSNDTNYYVNPASTSNIRKTNIVASGVGWEDHLNLYSSDGTNKWNLLVDNGASDSFRIAYNSSEKMRFETGGNVTTVGAHFSSDSFRAPIFYDSNNTGYYIDPASRSILADVEARNGINLRRDLGPSTGISFYSSSYYNWQIYMSPAAQTGCGANGNLTAPSGLGTVTNWALRSRMEGVSTYGWLWETGGGGGGGATASAVMELGATTGTLRVIGDMIAYASDERLKTNIKPIDGPIQKVKQISGVSYDWVDNIQEEYNFHPNNMHEVGVLAQEVQKVLPEAVMTAPMNAPYTEKTGIDHDFLTVKYERIVPLLIEAVKELSNKVEELENKLNGTN